MRTLVKTTSAIWYSSIAPAGRGTRALHGRRPVELAVFHHRQDAGLVLQDGDVLERVAIDQQDVREVALTDVAEDLAHAHHRAAPCSGREESFHVAHADVLDEVFEILGIGSVRGPRETVVTAWQDPDAAFAHRTHALDRCLELAVVAHLAGNF